jgi:hypothetical protein
MVAEVGMGEGMNEDDASIIKAAKVLRAAGYKVEADAKFGRWWVDDGQWVADGQLIEFAVNLGLLTHPVKG